jgi:hypothetical protein
LRQKASDASNVAKGSAKHGFNDHHDIGQHQHIALLRVGVDHLFTLDYLIARGLDGPEALHHNALVTQAAEVVLARWDQLVVLSNQAGGVANTTFKLVLRGSQFLADVKLRLAAYDALYGHLHPAVGEIPQWLGEPGIKGWWQAIAQRAGGQLTLEQLRVKPGNLDPHTLRDLRTGRSLPKESTIEMLATKLSDLQAKDGSEESTAIRAELEFELRLAIAVAEYQGLARHLLRRRSSGAAARLIAAMSSPEREELEDILRGGMQSKTFRERLQPLASQVLKDVAVEWQAELTRQVAHDPMAVCESLPSLFREQAVEEQSKHDQARAILAADLSDAGFHDQVLELTKDHQGTALLRCVRAYSLLQLGDREVAEGLVRGVIEEDSKHAHAHRVLAACKRAAGDEKEARKHDRKARFLLRGVGTPA